MLWKWGSGVLRVQSANCWECKVLIVQSAESAKYSECKVQSTQECKVRSAKCSECKVRSAKCSECKVQSTQECKIAESAKCKVLKSTKCKVLRNAKQKYPECEQPWKGKRERGTKMKGGETDSIKWWMSMDQTIGKTLDGKECVKRQWDERSGMEKIWVATKLRCRWQTRAELKKNKMWQARHRKEGANALNVDVA